MKLPWFLVLGFNYCFQPISTTAASVPFSSTSTVSNRIRQENGESNKVDMDVNPQQDQAQVPQERKRALMDYESISLALRLTCEMNRRLQNACASKPSSSHQQSIKTPSTTTTDAIHPPSYHPHSNHFAHPQNKIITNDDTYKSTTDIFHSNSSSNKNIISNLSTYIQSISKILGYETNPIIPALALIYLDRACSIETSTHRIHGMTNDNDINRKRCPYITPNTTHKLYLTAIVLACRTVRNQYSTSMNHGFHDEYTMQYSTLLQNNHELLCGMNVTYIELGSWLNYMVSSLGSDHGLIISSDEVNLFLRRWKNLFQWEDDSLCENDCDSIDKQRALLGPNNGHDHDQGQSEDSSISSTSSSPSEHIYDGDGNNNKEDSVVDNINTQEGYIDMDNTNRIDDLDSGLGYQNGEFHYYERQEIHYSQQGHPDFDRGDFWWST